MDDREFPVHNKGVNGVGKRDKKGKERGEKEITFSFREGKYEVVFLQN